MNQAKSGVVKQEMARVSINILGIKLKWTGMGSFNSDDHYFYYSGQESLGINGVALIVNKKSEMQYFGAVSKKKDLSVRFQGKSFNITVIQVYAPTVNAEKLDSSMVTYKTF